MPYDKIRESLSRCREAAKRGDAPLEREALIESVEHLAAAAEMEFTQVKAALSHLAMLLERDGEGRR